LTTDNTNSKIDLGDDLLAEPTREVAAPAQTKRQSPEDRYSSGRIFFNEGIHEEAKRLLHENLIDAPDHLPSRKLLEEIHDLELKQIFGEQGTYGNWKRRPQDEVSLVRELDPRRIDTDDIVRRLDRDLELGIHGARPSLLAEKTQTDQLVAGVESSLSGGCEQDRIDIAIGFVEMGFYDLASRLLRPLAHSENTGMRFSGIALLAFSLICGSQAFEAGLILQPVLQETDLTPEQRAEFLYLMGRACESLQKPDEALGWYFQAASAIARYRDVEDRIARLSSR
jgi:hypothetical protein